MKLRNTPLSWRKDWALYRSIPGEDSRGNPVRRYDMTTPDFEGKANTASGVAWHIASHEATVQEYGEGVTASASFLLDADGPEIAPFDRCTFGGAVWEVRSVLLRSTFRTIKLVEVS